MAAHITDPDGPAGSAADRYAGIVLGDGTVLLFDREEPDGWLRSDVTVDRHALR